MVTVEITNEEIQAIDVLSKNTNVPTQVGWIIENFKNKVVQSFKKEQEDAILKRAKEIIKEEELIKKKKDD
jgi:hypothetical protein